MRRFLLPLLLVCSAVLVARAQAPAPPVLPLYSGSIPGARPGTGPEKVTNEKGKIRIAEVVEPTLTVFAPARPNGTAVIICPGGGYAMLAMDHEGYDVARRLNEWGITAFVLKYRLPNDQSQLDKSQAPLLDAQQALRVVRQRAAEFGVNPVRVGMLGFSAGGHLASTAGTHFVTPPAETREPTSVRPDFLMLIYPVISLSDSLMHAGSRTHLLGAAPAAAQIRRYSNDQQVTTQTPPTFLVHAQDDEVVKVQNSLRFYEACLQHRVPVEMHLYPKGGHGFGMHNPTTPDNWTDRLRNWLSAGGWLR
ncbi:alpha/beta hydrolase [Hymenobacter sp. NST-14]|uniref:alpha/beta hydrolase n=1 Tax=Hymenobacter piscis TaxID=2839984 RepID=UPI001C01793B|nr:alpha/beta hydrolase [Hymenobacter piscis]MBT9393373.1 alpha/beta hydrolase [Hymenobacter piscis]